MLVITQFPIINFINCILLIENDQDNQYKHVYLLPTLESFRTLKSIIFPIASPSSNTHTILSPF